MPGSFLVDGHITVAGKRVWKTSTLRAIHRESYCKGPCAIHAPSPHKMANWPLVWDQRNARLLRICEHLYEHPDPDPDDYSYWKRMCQSPGHECDGCCDGVTQSI